LFFGDSASYTFALSNHDAETSLTLNAFPQRVGGQWRNGSLDVDLENFHSKHETKATWSMKPVVIGPGMIAYGRFGLDEFGEITGVGEGPVQLALTVTNSKGAEFTVKSNPQTLHVIHVPRSIRGPQELGIRAVTLALEQYCVDYSRFPPMQAADPVPVIPSSLTTPIPYLSAEEAHAARSLAVVTSFSTYCVAGKGFDNDWDLLPAIDARDWGALKWDEAIEAVDDFQAYAYDPTNGAGSSGDQLITSQDKGWLADQEARYGGPVRPLDKSVDLPPESKTIKR